MIIGRKIKAFLGALCVCWPLAMQGHEYTVVEDSVENKKLEFGLYTEVNYGRLAENEPRNLWDFPHAIFDATAHLGKGWHINLEFEYERFYENGEWGNNFNDNFTANKVYVSKNFKSSFGIKAGIIEVPVGIVNIDGPALTIYDPENESALLPMTWHEGGMGIYGDIGKFSYCLAGYVFTAIPAVESKFLGGAFRLDYHPKEYFRIGVSSYWGTPCKSNAHRADLTYLEHDGLLYGAVDFEYDRNGLIAEGSLIYNTDHSARSAGIEVGYDLFQYSSVSLIPFVRYDGVNHMGEDNFNKYTFGVNFLPMENLTVKCEYSNRRQQHETFQSFNVGVGIQL